MIIEPALIGRWGNNLFNYAFVRALAERDGHHFECRDWIGAKIFDLNDKNALDYPPNEESQVNHDYAQRQECLIYTRSQVKQWFKFKPEIEKKLEALNSTTRPIMAHRRVGDYPDLGYVVVSWSSYFEAAEINGYEPVEVGFATDANPQPTVSGFEEYPWLPDFYCLMKAKVLFRGNSTFSFWAAVLADDDQKVYSPRIDGLEGGREQDCEFEEGNHCKFADLPFITDLHLAP